MSETDALREWVVKNRTEAEGLEEAWSALSNLSDLDKLKLMFYLTKRWPAITEGELFIKYAEAMRHHKL